MLDLTPTSREEEFRWSACTKGQRGVLDVALWGMPRVNQVLSERDVDGYDGAGRTERNDWRTGPRGTNRNRGNGSSIFP
ncbi:hypothetical protein EAG_00649 [Camponotus floridanus]|uniref:Uncharacterized protein n=1 Tax=Camponotus floridanus TaxID=104421 RepID=E2A7K3_CAMFO|nr:hypothetical protein EAG_00649 [Camponotus floridanus]